MLSICVSGDNPLSCKLRSWFFVRQLNASIPREPIFLQSRNFKCKREGTREARRAIALLLTSMFVRLKVVNAKKFRTNADLIFEVSEPLVFTNSNVSSFAELKEDLTMSLAEIKYVRNSLGSCHHGDVSALNF
jgi:hypothetical protein